MPLDFTQCHSLSKDDIEETIIVSPLYPMENGKVFNTLFPLDTAIPDKHDFIFIKEVDTTSVVLYLGGGGGGQCHIRLLVLGEGGMKVTRN